MITFVQTPGLVDVYEAPRLMRIACMMRSAGWSVRYDYRAGQWGILRWRHLWADSARHRWNGYWCCPGYECGCYGISTAEYYTGDDWLQSSYDELYGTKGTEDADL